MSIDLLAEALENAGFDVSNEFPMLRRSLDLDDATVVSFGWISAPTARRLVTMLNVATGNEVERSPTPFERLPKGWPPYAWIADSIGGRIAGGEFGRWLPSEIDLVVSHVPRRGWVARV